MRATDNWGKVLTDPKYGFEGGLQAALFRLLSAPAPPSYRNKQYKASTMFGIFITLNVAMQHRKLSSVFCNDLEGWNEREGGRLKREGTYECVLCFLGDSAIKNPPANAEDLGLIPRLGRSPGEGNGNPLQYSGLGNPMDRVTWQATVHGVTKRWTRLND